MKKTQTFMLTALAALMAAPASAAFVDDAQSRIELRNFYFNRDFRQSDAAQSKADEWAQGVRAYWQSGYTEGRLGFGLDAIGLLGIKLDSSPDRTGTGILKRDTSENRAMDEYSELGLTARLKLDEHVLRLGTLIPTLPVAMHNDSRLLPQSFRGGWLQAQGSDTLQLELGRFDAINLRDSSDYQDMRPVQGGARNVIVSGKQDSDAFDFAGATWAISDASKLSYHYGELQSIYRQHYLVFNHSQPLG
ncbi:MAG: OprD family outer membrane porin, partial [Halopseudomonas aestusnigri]|nr:OprD family outer membrane porin [Halopseudomonas aestusnigri]